AEIEWKIELKMGGSDHPFLPMVNDSGKLYGKR
ncbi:unnamed protein product, partial [marine sediment metagenome]